MPHVNNAMSCGVWGRIWTFSNGTSLEPVAVGFSAAGRYLGPSPCSGAGEETPVCVLVAIIDRGSLILHGDVPLGYCFNWPERKDGWQLGILVMYSVKGEVNDLNIRLEDQ